MDRIKVCHICNMDLNGKSAFVCSLLENTDFEKYDVTVIAYRTVYVRSVMFRLEKLPVRIVTPPSGGILTFCRFLDMFLRENRFDVCHAHMWDQSGLFLLIAHRRGIPVRVAHSHTTSKAEGRYCHLKEFFRDRILWYLLRHMIGRHANRFIACSETAAHWLFPSSVIQGKRYFVVPNGIDLAKYRCPDRQRHVPVHILYTGSLVLEKNPVFVVQVYYEYLKQDPDARMTMIGRGKLDGPVREEIARLGIAEHITLVSETDDMPRFYKSADVFLLPSCIEGLGIVLIEAQASGLPCLVSDFVPPEAQCGLLTYKALDDGPSAWAGYITEVLQNKDKAIDMNRLMRYDAKNTARIMDRIYGL